MCWDGIAGFSGATSAHNPVPQAHLTPHRRLCISLLQRDRFPRQPCMVRERERRFDHDGNVNVNGNGNVDDPRPWHAAREGGVPRLAKVRVLGVLLGGGHAWVVVIGHKRCPSTFRLINEVISRAEFHLQVGASLSGSCNSPPGCIRRLCRSRWILVASRRPRRGSRANRPRAES